MISKETAELVVIFLKRTPVLPTERPTLNHCIAEMGRLYKLGEQIEASNQEPAKDED